MQNGSQRVIIELKGVEKTYFLEGDNPTLLASDPELAVDVAVWFWATRGLNEPADRDDLRLITRRINGGYNGLADRAAHLAQAKWFLC